MNKQGNHTLYWPRRVHRPVSYCQESQNNQSLWIFTRVSENKSRVQFLNAEYSLASQSKMSRISVTTANSKKTWHGCWVRCAHFQRGKESITETTMWIVQLSEKFKDLSVQIDFHMGKSENSDKTKFSFLPRSILRFATNPYLFDSYHTHSLTSLVLLVNIKNLSSLTFLMMLH